MPNCDEGNDWKCGERENWRLFDRCDTVRGFSERALNICSSDSNSSDQMDRITTNILKTAATQVLLVNMKFFREGLESSVGRSLVLI